MAAISPATLPAAAVPGSGLSSSTRRSNSRAVVYVGGLSSFGGLKAHSRVATLGLSKSSDEAFAVFAGSLRSPAASKKGRGGALTSAKCDAAGEIFRIAAIMNGLVLVGVAVGFVLLRIEASLEEAE